ncbi:hypothetical protein V8E53_009910 [Lactarius tabidus]
MKVGGPKLTPHTLLLQYYGKTCFVDIYERSRNLNEDGANVQALLESTNDSTAHANPPELWSKTRTLPLERLFREILDLVVLLHPLVASTISTITRQAQTLSPSNRSRSGFAHVYRIPCPLFPSQMGAEVKLLDHSLLSSHSFYLKTLAAQTSHRQVAHLIIFLYLICIAVVDTAPSRFPILQGGIIRHPYRDQSFSITPPSSPLE